MTLRPAVVAVFLMLLAGCTERNASGENDGGLPSLAEFSTCPAYPDGTANDCVDRANRLAVTAPTPPPGWLCVGRHSGPIHDLRTFWNPATGQHGGSATVTALSGPIGGLIVYETPGQDRRAVQIHRWNADQPRAFLELPSDARDFSLTYEVYQARLASNTTVIQAATLEEAWSLFEGRVWRVFTIHAGKEAYHFPAMRYSPVTNSYLPTMVEIVGADFDIQISYHSLGFISLGRPGTVPSCELPS